MELGNKVIFQDDLWEVISFATERRIDGDTFYNLRNVKSPDIITKQVNKKFCKPAPTGGYVGKTVDHASVTHVFYKDRQYRVDGYEAEKRINGNVWYYLVNKYDPTEKLLRVDAKECTPFIPADIDLSMKENTEAINVPKCVEFQDKFYYVVDAHRSSNIVYFDLVNVDNPLDTEFHVNSRYCSPVPLGIVLKGQEFGEKKTKPTEVTEEMIDEAIEKSRVYQEAVKALREQVAYGLRKYPEPLNYKTWNFIESIDHALGENSDKQHYLSMMKIQAEFLIHIDIVIDKLLQAYTSTDPVKVLHNMIYELQQRQEELERKFSTTKPID